MRHHEADCLGGREIDDQLEFGRLLHRKIAGLRPREDPPDIQPDRAPRALGLAPVADQATGLGKGAVVEDRRDRMADRERRELRAANIEERIGGDEKRAISLLDERCEGRIDSLAVLAVSLSNRMPLTLAASCRSLGISPRSVETGLAGLTSSATVRISGTSSDAAQAVSGTARWPER